MSLVYLPDGSRILPRLEAPNEYLFEASEPLDELVYRLMPLAAQDSGMDDLRHLLAIEQEDSDPRYLTDHEVATGVGILIKSGRLVWTGGSAGETAVHGGYGGKIAPKPAAPVEKPKEKVHVTPKLEVEMKIVLFDRGLEKHLSDPKYPADPTFIKCSISQSPYTPKFEKGATLKVDGAGAVEAYEDEKLTKKFDIAKPIPNAKLTAAEPLKLWLKGTKQGKFTLKLEVESASAPFIAEKPAEEKMGVVEVQFTLHDQDLDAIKKVQVDPDVDTYLDDLKAKKLPDQKALSDADKIKKGRLLHVQKDGNHGRAKLILKKLVAAEWPDGTDDYSIILTGSESADSTKTGVGVEVLDLEFDGGAKDEIKVSAAKAADTTLWVQGKTASKKLLDFRLDAGVSGAGAKKRNGDWARFTVVQIKEIKFEVSTDGGKPVVWDWTKKRFFINTDATPAGRELKDKPGAGKRIKVKAILTEKIKDIAIHFMLAGHKNNFDPEKWIDSTKSTAVFKWSKLKKELKPVDKKDRKDLVHLSAATDGDGAALMKDLVLSRLGGERYQIGAYISHDPHLAKYTQGHADLSKHKPVLGDEFSIWRRVWAQITRNKDTTVETRASTVTAYESMSIEYKEVDEKTFDKSTIAGLVEHPKWMFEAGGGDDKVICVGDHNKDKFHGLYVAPSADHKPKSHLIIVDVQWDPQVSGAMAWNTETNPAVRVCRNAAGDRRLGVVRPTLDGGTLVVSGIWTWNDGTNVHTGAIQNTDIVIEKTRGHPSEFKVNLPAQCSCHTPKVAIAVSATKKAAIALQLNAASGPWNGESGTPHCLIRARVGVHSTISHEIGHQFNQVREVKSWLGVPDHPTQYIKHGGQGSHCSFGATVGTATDADGNPHWVDGTCFMYHAGSASRTAFCDNCKTDLRVRDLTGFAIDS